MARRWRRRSSFQGKGQGGAGSVDMAEVAGTGVLEAAPVQAALAAAEARLAGGGRLVVRPSGTEPPIRIMAEHEDAALAGEALAVLAGAIRRQAGG